MIFELRFSFIIHTPMCSIFIYFDGNAKVDNGSVSISIGDNCDETAEKNKNKSFFGVSYTQPCNKIKLKTSYNSP